MGGRLLLHEHFAVAGLYAGFRAIRLDLTARRHTKFLALLFFRLGARGRDKHSRRVPAAARRTRFEITYRSCLGGIRLGADRRARIRFGRAGEMDHAIVADSRSDARVLLLASSGLDPGRGLVDLDSGGSGYGAHLVSSGSRVWAARRERGCTLIVIILDASTSYRDLRQR